MPPFDPDFDHDKQSQLSLGPSSTPSLSFSRLAHRPDTEARWAEERPGRARQGM